MTIPQTHIDCKYHNDIRIASMRGTPCMGIYVNIHAYYVYNNKFYTEHNIIHTLISFKTQ